MPKYLLTLVLLAFSFSLSAQDNTMTPSNNSTDPAGSVAKAKVLLIPYEPRLYMSRIDRKISENTGLSMYQIKQRMRYGLQHQLFAAVADQKFGALSMLNADDQEIQKDLMYIYNSIGYKYTVMPVEAEEEAAEPQKGLDKLKGLFTTGDGDDVVAPEPGNEQQEVYSNEERYMNTTIINPNLFNFLGSKYESDYYVFVNQLDITDEVGSDSYSYAKNNHMRRIKVHYTIFDKLGNQVYGGASIAYFPGKVNDLNGIIKGYFPAVAKGIAKHLPGALLTEEEKERQAKANAQREVIGGY